MAMIMSNDNAVGGFNESLIAARYDKTKSYGKGDFCIYKTTLYKCKESTSGPFDASKWESTSCANAISSGMGVKQFIGTTEEFTAALQRGELTVGQDIILTDDFDDNQLEGRVKSVEESVSSLNTTVTDINKPATTTESGLMSSEDKTKLDSVQFTNKITISTSNPTSSDGSDGDIWFVYQA